MLDLSSLDEMLSDVSDAVELGLDEAAEAALVVAQSHTEGALAQSLYIRKTGTGERLITTDKDYAGFVENGRPAISAHRGGVLRFVVNGETIFRRSVGPAAARPFMAPAGDFLDDHAGEFVARAIGRMS